MGPAELVSRQVLDEVEETARDGLLDLLDGGLDLDEALDLVALLLDLALPLRAILPPPLGTLAENADRAAFRSLLDVLADSARPNAERAEKGADRAEIRGHFAVAARRRARAARIRSRQGAD